MSIARNSWAGDQRGISPLAKLLLIRLADASDEQGWISWQLEHTAAWCGATAAEIGVAFGDLVDAGLVSHVDDRWRLPGGDA
ncbi:hypothetical protein [uncultured Phenylobacterium sp.]|uniref:hypothetical protein n=1 Tax=uncultured Phenylobacterium sp. TaxID=349273 RepID=UPI0025D0275F|nr:hypothetical protein [uncultured Phenylobacterium sp.]